MTLDIIIAILGSGAFMTMLTYVFTRKKTSAETGKINIESYTSLLDAMRDASERMEKSLSITQESFKDSMTKIRELLTENTLLMIEMSQMKAELSGLRIDIDLLRNVNAKLMEKMVKLNETNQRLSNEIVNNEGTIKKLNSKINTLTLKLEKIERGEA